MPSIKCNSRRSDSMLCDKLDNIKDQMMASDAQKEDPALEDRTFILDKNH